MRLLASLATFVAGVALASVLAYWGWQLFAPAPVQIPSVGPQNPAAALVAANLFGASGPATPATRADVAILGGDVRLLGTIAASGERGYALFRLPSGPKLVAQGAEIASGATLVSVGRDAIVVRDGGGERRFVLRGAEAGSKAGSSKGAESRTPAAPTLAKASATCAPPSGFRGPVVRLNTELLAGVGADSIPWRNLLATGAGGLTVRESNGFGAMLGLQAGDRIAQANGIALNVPEDVGSAVVRPLVANQGVRLSGSRAGAPHEVWLANVACAG
jgi:type II secretory pathway component PulC